MESTEFTRLGVSEPPPVSSEQENTTESTCSGPGYPLPLWIQHPTNSVSQTHLTNCLAWWLVTTKTADQVNAHVDGMASRPNQQQALRLAALRCQAWIWLQRYSTADIRAALEKMPVAGAGVLRRELNCIRTMIKSHTEGDTYE